MRKAEEEVLVQEPGGGMEVSLLVKDFFDGPVEAVLQRMAVARAAGGQRRRRHRGRRGRRARRAGDGLRRRRGSPTN